MYFGKSNFLSQSVGCVRKSQIIPLDSGLRKDGIRALDLWDLVSAVLHPCKNIRSLVVDKWKEHLECLLGTKEFEEFFGIDGGPFEFESNIFPEHSIVQILREIQLKGQ